MKSDASAQDIREAYRKLAFQYHPDRNKDDPRSNEKMKAINEAYATLADSAKRKEYDSLRERFGAAAYDRFRQTYSQEDIFRNSDIDQIINEFSRSFGFRNANQVFRQFYGENFRVYFYGQPDFNFQNYNRNQAEIPGAAPSAARPGLAEKLIKFFLRRIFRFEMPERGKDIGDVIRPGVELAQAGGETEYKYRKRGQSKNLMVKIPAGIKDGQIIKLRELGAPGKGGGAPGDLLLTVRIKVPLSRKIRNCFRQQK